MFLQIHTLTSYHASLLNRDDAGLAKRIPFGDADRVRISSQCLKRHWRLAIRDGLELPGGIRSRYFFDREVFRRAVAEGVDEDTALALTEKLLGTLMTRSKSKTDQADRDEQDAGPLFLKQPVLFGKPEADYFVGLIRECAQSGSDPKDVLEDRLKEHKRNFRALLAASGGDDLIAGVEGAMFGRFVTSDILARTDASVHVAHAFTVHALDNEVDYFTVVDDLKEAGEHAGAAHAGDMELGSGLYYGYVVVDVPLLVSNLSGCARDDWLEHPEAIDDARDVISGLVTAITTVSPGAKLGATAPYARTDCVLLETGDAQPRSLANAFLSSLPPRGDVMQEAINTLGRYVDRLDGMYGVDTSRFIASTRETDAVPAVRAAPLKPTVETALDSVFGGS